MGGGVLLDLSHELDYAQWLLGELHLKNVINKKVSNLEIDTDDILSISATSEKAENIQIDLNYFTRLPTRQILINGEGLCIKADLNDHKLRYILNNESEVFETFEGFEIEKTYLDQHQCIQENQFESLCTFDEGLQTMGLIDRIRQFPK